MKYVCNKDPLSFLHQSLLQLTPVSYENASPRSTTFSTPSGAEAARLHCGRQHCQQGGCRANKGGRPCTLPTRWVMGVRAPAWM